MATKSNSAENLENKELEAQATVEAATEEAKVGLFTKIGKMIDGGIQKAKDFGKRNGKKIAKGAGVAVGTVAAVAGTAMLVDTVERAKALEEGTASTDNVIDVNPVGAYSADEDPFEGGEVAA